MSSTESPIPLALAGFVQGTLQLHTQLSTYKYGPNDLFDSPGLPMTEGDMENFKKAQANAITPPATQQLPVIDSFETEDEQDQALVAVPGAAPRTTTAPLFHVAPTAGKITLPGKFKSTFDCNLFGDFMAAVYTCADSDLRLCEYLGKGIKVTLHDRLYLDREPERISFEELWFRATKFLSLEIPGSKPEMGMELACRFNTTAYRGWFFAGRLAFEGKLDDVPTQVTADFLEAKWCRERSLPPRLTKAVAAKPKMPAKGRPAIQRRNGNPTPAHNHNHLLERLTAAAAYAEELRYGRPMTRERSVRKRKPSPKAVAELETQQAEESAIAAVINPTKASVPQAASPPRIMLKLKRTPTNSQASTDSATPEPAASVESIESAKPVPRVAATASSKKRKRDTTDDSSPVSTKSAKRTAFDFNNNGEGPPGRFAQAVKHFLNEKSNNPADYATFADGQALSPSNGPGSSKDKEERALAAEQKFTDSQYKCQKYRFFLAAAMLTEQNVRIEEHKAAGHDVKINLLNLNKTQIQLYNNVDVNKSSKLFAKFKEFGWIPDNITTGTDKKKTVNSFYTTMFPAEKRKALLDELMAFEATKVTDEAKRVVLPSLG